MKLSAIAIVSLFTSASCAPTATYAVHERRHLGDLRWRPRDVPLDSRTVLPLSIGLTQQNLHKGHDFLMDVSDPTSPNYANHWTPEQIAEAFAPTVETINAVKEWLASFGIDEDRISISKSSSWIRFNCTVGEVEELLKTKYKIYEHSKTKKTHLACDEYSLPVDIKAHIDFITPTIGFEAYLIEPRSKARSLFMRDKEATPADNISELLQRSVAPAVNLTSNFTFPLPPTDPTAPFASCSTIGISPACLRALYGIPVGSLAKSSFGIVEFSPNYYLQGDLETFFENLAPNVPQDYLPTMASIDGGTQQINTSTETFTYNSEPDLDFEYAIALVYPQKVTLYQVGDSVEGGSLDTFLDAIDGSYCTYEGGDNIQFDPTYPDPKSGGYKGPKNCGGLTPTSVISISYTWDEGFLTASYMNRQCNEFMKLGLAGVTVVTSSGDFGVAGNHNKCCTDEGCVGRYTNQAGAAGSFNPSFPSTCPYITSVGATQMVPGAAITTAEEACGTAIYSGGGFSNNFALPSWQASAVKTYFEYYKPSYSAILYNNSGKSRGIPDISANGAFYLIELDGIGQHIFGTSASTPIVGSIISLINEQRIASGKKPVGFINPVLYANPSAMNDITEGNNPGCGTSGFSAVPGWDPVTGLGTPNYPALLKVFMALQ
ncbi:subtilisin-like protein [Stipitochalara longipes BDJ]|nr:subtilisin-like protein [Stipitochalara longipes BDJ]